MTLSADPAFMGGTFEEFRRAREGQQLAMLRKDILGQAAQRRVAALEKALQAIVDAPTDFALHDAVLAAVPVLLEKWRPADIASGPPGWPAADIWGIGPLTAADVQDLGII